MEQTLTENGVIVDTAPAGTWTTAAAWAESLIMFNAFAETCWSVEAKTDTTAIIIVQGDTYTFAITEEDRTMKTSAIATVKWFIEQGLTIQLSSPSGLHDIDIDEAIDAIEECEDDDIRVEDDVIIFGMGDVCIKARN
jgi:uncharacterized protein YqgV (UPF0045/DUF77 family)